ncbi:MAG: hypothetical protein ABH830_03915 [Patescibacteria group bacterium]
MKVVITSIWQSSTKRRAILNYKELQSYPKAFKDEVNRRRNRLPMKLKKIIKVAKRQPIQKVELVIDLFDKQVNVQIHYFPKISTYRLDFNWREIAGSSDEEISIAIKKIINDTVLTAAKEIKEKSRQLLDSLSLKKSLK